MTTLGTQGLEEIKKQRATFLSRMRFLEEKKSSLDANTSSKSEMLDLLREVRAECSRLTNPLPIYASREEIVERVSSSQVSIIIGETGSGKSTQIIQYLHDAGFSKNKKIVCAQPRKVAALSLAKRVAQEMGISYVGGLVGYSVGGDKKMSAKTRMLFSTDSCLLNECLEDPLFSNYSCIIIDEAHERCLYTDLLIGMIKACLPERPDLKIVITSATFDPQVFIDYFDCELELRIGGTSYEVVVEYDDTGETEDFERYEQRAVSKAMEIHKTEEQPGDILIFLTSPVEIMRCIDEFEKQMGKGGEEENGSKNFKCLPLHGQLSPDLQMKVFEPLPVGTRKVVFATNCAETSLTIDGIRYVIDSGLVKEVRYNPKKNISLIDICPISQSSANQRKGRAGRTASGKCYRLYSEEGYERMAPDTDPEILRVPLGQAVLKLAAMGIDVRTYDFVQSPKKDAIDCAVTTLHGLQALTPEGSITPIGEWLASLPTDPKEGYLIHEGNKHNLLYDTIVLAALISNGSTMFYRGLTEKEEQVAAKSKNLYASPNGDIFSWLEVYKKWLEIPKEKQSKWCQEHGINYKVMGYIKKYVSEVIAVLKKKHKIEVPRTFATNKSSQLASQKLVFETYMSSLCQYLGHRRAGYKSLITDDKFQIHPSSTLNALNIQPMWIIYTELTRTSRDFIKGITLVEEEWIIEAVEQGKLSLDIEDLKQQRVVLVQTEELGTSVFNHMKGPRYSRLRDLEKELTTKFGMDNVVVDADGDFKILNVYSSSSMNQEAQNYINEQKSKIVGQLTFEEDAVSFFNPNKKREEIYRVHLGQGGMVRALFMPNQSDEIIIKRSSLHTSEEDMRMKFNKFGQIKECRKGGVQGAWGTIRYATVAEAQKAVENTRHDEDDAAVLNCKTQNISKHETFKVKLSWIRRPIKKPRVAFIECPEEDEPLLIGKYVFLDDNNSAKIHWSRSLRTLYINIKNSEDIEEWRIELQVMKLLNYTEDQKDDVWVTMERERARVLTREEKEDLEENLMRLCEDLMPDEFFSVEVIYPNAESVFQVAFIHFESATGYQSCKKLVGKLNVFGQAVTINPKLKTNIRVSENVMNFCTSQFEDIKTVFEKMDIRLEREEMQEGGYLIEINSSNADHLEKAKEILMRFSQGNKVECGEGTGLRNILKPSVKRKLNEIEKDSQTLIIADNHNETLHIYGDTKNVRNAEDSIKILAEYHQNKYKLRSPGTLKALMTEFKNLNEDLAERFALTDVSTDFKQQVLFLFGPPETVRKACDFIADMEANLPKEFVARQVEESPHCVVCLNAIEESVDLYRLEACGHSYCRSCIKLQVTFSVDNHHFPITCAEQGCNQPLVWKDFLFFIRRKWTTREQLTKASLNVFVRANRDKHRYCITPDCEMIYAITNDVEGNKFECPACRVHICSSCHTPFHPGVNCKGETPDNRLKKWMKEDPKTRKHCPKCNAPIEKRVGCEHVVCKNCKVDFCWQCLEMFSGDQECYKHIREQHEPL